MPRNITQEQLKEYLDNLEKVTREDENKGAGGDAAGYLDPDRAKPTVTVVRSIKELEALDPDTLLVYGSEQVASAWGVLNRIRFPFFNQPTLLPAIIITPGHVVKTAKRHLRTKL